MKGVDRPTISTDMANVSLVVPSIHPVLMIPTNGAINHQPEFTAACVTPEADRAVLAGAIALAHTAIGVAQRREAARATDGPRVMLEHVVVAVTPGREEEFEASAREALPIIDSAAGASAESFVDRRRTVRCTCSSFAGRRSRRIWRGARPTTSNDGAS